jgi:hypothetical protein
MSTCSPHDSCVPMRTSTVELGSPPTPMVSEARKSTCSPSVMLSSRPEGRPESKVTKDDGSVVTRSGSGNGLATAAAAVPTPGTAAAAVTVITITTTAPSARRTHLRRGIRPSPSSMWRRTSHPDR